jgi:uncharacterized membrane protein YgdD (TMEM256/DUF423 family)
VNWGATGAALVGLAVMIGAFGAHALRERLDAYATGIYERAVFYHFIHAAGLVGVGIAIAAGAVAPGLAGIAAWLLLAGIVVFSGSLYALALSGIKMLGAITPLGGLAFIGGWATLAYAFAAGTAR